MHFFKVVGVLTGVVAAAGAVNENLGCSSGDVVTVTSINTVTKTVAADSQSSSVPSTTVATITETVAETFTIFVSPSSAPSPIFSSTPATDEKGLSALPPGVTGTSTIFLTSTNVLTVGGASYISSTPKVQASSTSALAVQEATPLSSTLAKGFTGFGTHGWNSSATTLRKGMTRGSEPGTFTYATGAANIPFGFPEPSYSASPPVSSSLLVSGDKMKIKRAPQVGAIITATINGVVVSWTNNYDGSSPATSTPVSSSFGPSSSLTTMGMPLGPPLPTFAVPPTTAAESQISSSCEETTMPTPTSFSLMPSSFMATSSSTTLPAQAIPFGPPSIRHSQLSTRSLEPLPSTSSTSAPRFTTSFVPLYSNASTTVSAAATQTSSVCTGPIRNTGNFTIDFDDLPTLSASPNTTNYPPIFSTYHKLFWANGFAYVPPPKDPYLPISPPQLAVFITDPTANVHADNSTVGLGEEGYGEFGAGPRYAESAYWIDAYSAYVGCNNTGPADCMITINGYTYEPHFKNVVLNALQVVYQPPCPALTNCDFLSVTLNNDFRKLVGLQIVATVGEERVAWFMDDLEVGWSNNTCAAGKQRDSSRQR